MFGQIRRQLIVYYTIFTGIALLLFAVVFYFGLSFVLLREQAHTVSAAAAEQAISQYYHFRKPGKVNGEGNADEKKEEVAENALIKLPQNALYFYYAVAANGVIVQRHDLFPHMRAQFLSKVQDWRTPHTGIVSMKMPNGKDMRFMTAGVPVYSHGRLLGMVYIGKDLSAYDHLLKRLIQALALSFMVFLLIAALTGYVAANKALIPIKHAFAAQRRFAADASHELRAPLSVFQASLEVLEHQESGKLTQLSQQVIADLKDEVGRMTRLVSDLLTLARADAGAVELDFQPVDLRLVANQAMRSFNGIADKKQIVLSLLMPNQLSVFADKDRISQLFYIFIDNALKFTPNNGQVTVTISLAVEDHVEYAVIQFQDTGIGMSPEEQEKIFERFYRVDKARARMISGYGLGLSIAAWIIRAHHGRIKVISALEQGSTFIVSIPINK
jgi:signal transduction histidine kinase